MIKRAPEIPISDLKIFIGVASQDGRIKYHETDLSYLLSSS